MQNSALPGWARGCFEKMGSWPVVPTPGKCGILEFRGGTDGVLRLADGVFRFGSWTVVASA